MHTISLFAIIGIILSTVGMVIVWVRCSHSRFTALIPGVNYYIRTQIAGRGIQLRIITSIINITLLTIIVINRHNLTAINISEPRLFEYLFSLPSLITQNRVTIISWLVLQIRANRGVAHHRNRSLRTGLELTFLPWIFWIILGISSKNNDIN